MKIFIAGPRAISKLNRTVEDKLRSIYEHNHTVLIGDANGIDRAVQEYLAMLNYLKVIVYASNGKARNNIGNWPIETISVPEHITGFNFYAAKDLAMASEADCGFMIWNGESRGTLNNVINLLNESKEVVLFFTPDNSLIRLGSFERLEMLLQRCNGDAKMVCEKLRRKKKNPVAAMQLQTSLF